MAQALGGCAILVPQTIALRDALPKDLPQHVELEKVPFFPQVEYQCGPAALATVLVHAGARVTPEALVPQVWLPERKGSLQVEMLAATRRNGMVPYLLAPRYEDLLREIAAGNPVVVLQNRGLFPFDRWHYAVAIGFDLKSGDLTLRSGEDRRETMPLAANEIMWRRSGYWAMLAQLPWRIPATATEPRWLDAVASLEPIDRRRAQAGYAAILQRWPASTGAAIGLANTHYASGELRVAEGILRRALQKAPDSVIVLNNLAQTLTDLGRHDEALDLIQRAAAAGGPHAPAVQQTRAQILKRLGRKP